MTTFETLSHVIDRIIHDADRELALAITSGAGTPEARAHTLTADGLQRAVRIVKAEREKYRTDGCSEDAGVRRARCWMHKQEEEWFRP
jgi:hypothetical protein